MNGVLHKINLIIDTTLCLIERPIDNEVQHLFYNGKHKKHGIKYEMAVNYRTGLISWIFGGVPGSVHDAKIFYEGGLSELLNPFEYYFGDKAYKWLPHFITPIKGA
jgi:hypothetical protein